MRHLEIVLDTSGSMCSIIDTVYAGARGLLADLDEDGTVRLTTFNSTVEVGSELSKQGGQDAFTPGRCQGMTALYDAVVQALTSAMERHTEENVVVAIVTDGLENASRKTVADVRASIERAHQKNWRVTFLGANQDAILTAHALGIRAERALTYGTSTEEVQHAYRALSDSNRRYDEGGDEGFTHAERMNSMNDHIRPRSLSEWERDSAHPPMHRWISLDPRSGRVDSYSDDVCIRLEDAVTSGVAQVDVPEFSASILLHQHGKHIQKTLTGERDVRRVTDGQTIQSKRIHGLGYRIVASGGQDVRV